MDDTPPQAAPADWIEALERSEAQLAAGQVVSGDAMHRRLRESIARMDRDTVISTLRAHEANLKAAGIVRLSLFGSTARDTASPGSDIDLLAVFDDARRLSLLDLIRLENTLADLLGRPVDLVEEGTLKPRVRKNVDQEAVRAF